MIKTNCKYYINGIAKFLGLLGVISTFIPISDTIAKLCAENHFPKFLGQTIAFFCSLIIGGIVSWFFSLFLTKGKLFWENGPKKICIQEGDILRGNHFYNRKKKIVVVHVNNDFDVKVEEPGQDSLISPTSVHGQWLTFFMRKYKMDENELNDLIQKRIKSDKEIYKSRMSLNKKDKPKGNLNRYAKGCVVPIKGKKDDDITYFLFALNEFDEHNHNKTVTKNDLRELFQKLIFYCNNNSQGQDVEMAIMGTNHTKPQLTTVEAVEMMLSVLFSNIERMKNNFTIITSHKCMKELEQTLED